MPIIAIDPGNEFSAYCIWDGEEIVDVNKIDNLAMRRYLFSQCKTGDITLAIEMIASYGMPVGKTVFETCVWIGRFIEVAMRAGLGSNRIKLVYRKDCKMFLCNNSRAKDSNIRRALLDLVGPQGTKKSPGPTYKIRGAGGKDAWAALSVAVTCEHILQNTLPRTVVNTV